MAATTLTAALAFDAVLGSPVLAVLDPATTPDAVLVAWLSEHLTALELVVYPAARRVLPDRREPRGQQALAHELAHDLEHALRRLHQRISGDGGAMHLPVARLRDEVRDLLSAHADAERQLESQLRAVLSP